MTAVNPRYRSGEAIEVGDRIKVGDWEGVVEDIVVPGCSLWEEHWKDATGAGVMLAGPAFGRLFAAFDDEELVFVQRKQGSFQTGLQD